MKLTQIGDAVLKVNSSRVRVKWANWYIDEAAHFGHDNWSIAPSWYIPSLRLAFSGSEDARSRTTWLSSWDEWSIARGMPDIRNESLAGDEWMLNWVWMNGEPEYLCGCSIGLWWCKTLGTEASRGSSNPAISSRRALPARPDLQGNDCLHSSDFSSSTSAIENARFYRLCALREFHGDDSQPDGLSVTPSDESKAKKKCLRRMPSLRISKRQTWRIKYRQPNGWVWTVRRRSNWGNSHVLV